MNPASLPLWADLLASVLLVLAAGFALVGAWGLARLDDFSSACTAPAKPARWAWAVPCWLRRWSLLALGAPAGTSC